MSVDSLLDQAFTTLLNKARGPAIEQAVRPATINFVFSNNGAALVVTTRDPLLVEVPFPCRIVWVHLYAGDKNGAPVAVTATVDLFLTQWDHFGTFAPVYGSGTPPHLTLDSVANADLSGWQLHLTTGDTLMARLRTFTGAASWLALTLQLRPTDVPIGISNVTDLAGSFVTDSAGNIVVSRS